MERRSRWLDEPAGPSALIRREDLADLVRGSLLLGCGGGGDTRTGELLARSALDRGPVRLTTVAETTRRDLVTLPVGVVGASGGVLDERIPSGSEFSQVLAGMETLTGTRVGAVLPIEAGGVNGPLGVWASADLGLPLVDADLCGRAVPRLDQMTAGMGRRSMVPAVCVDPDGRQVDVGAGGTSYSGPRLEAAVRALLAAGTGWLAIGFRPLKPEELAETVVSGAVSRCLRLGAALGAPRRVPGAGFAVAASVGADVLASGRVLGWRRPDFQVRGDTGWFTIESASGLVRVDVQSEILAVALDGKVVAQTPDVLAFLDTSDGQVLSLDSVRTGTQVAVIRIPPLLPLNREEFLSHVGPQAFGIQAAIPA